MAQATATGKGLEGVVATTSAISSIMGSTLTYRGIDINELADQSSFEEVIWLLWHGELPTRDELESLKRNLAGLRDLPDELIQEMRLFPSTANPMAATRSAVSVLAFYEPLSEDTSLEASKEEACRLQAKFPVMVAAFQRLRTGQDPVTPDPSLGEAANFLYMLRGERPSDLEAKIMDTALVLHADHELNASTFAARVAASTLSDMDSAVVAALCTLKGPLHGGANEAVMRMLEDIETPDNVDAYIRDALARKERIMGFGHRVYKEGDPRARWLKRMSRDLAERGGDMRWYAMSARIEEVVKEEKGLLPNVDFYSASVYHYLGIPHDLFTPIFAISRLSGYIAHIMEQYGDNRLIRPRADYVGPSQRHYVPIDRR